MTVYGALTVGRVTLTEDWQATVKADSNGRSLALAGQEAAAALGASQGAARDRAEALAAYEGAVVPVLFTALPHMNGWYRVGNVGTVESTWNEHTDIRWTASLDRVGADSEVEVESRLIGGNRTHSTSATAELWHAPVVGHDSYYVGTGTPGYVDRVGADGTVRVYRSIPAATNPRWGCQVGEYLLGASSITVNGVVRTGVTCADTPTSWLLTNGILKVEPRTSAGVLRVSSYLTSGYGTAKVFDVKRGTTSLGAASHVTILRNDPCECVIRLTWDHAPGRSTVDLSLKRGSRFVGLHVQQYAAAAALRVDDNAVSGTVNNALSSAGYINDTATDGDGNRWVIGTPLASAAAGTFGLAASVSALSLPAYIGCIRGGASPASGDAAADLNAQYLGTPTEAERVILR